MFDAGGIASKLNLDVTGFAGGMLQATSIAEAFPPVVTAFLANPLLGFIEVGKLAAAAAKTVGTAWLDAIKEIGGAADDAGESAAKLGVSVEFLTGWGAAFKDAGSSAEGLADALKFLNKNASEAAGGNETAVKAFGQLGISADFLKSNLGNTEAMARKVFDALGALPTAAQRSNVAMDLLGRGGSDLGAALGGGSKGLDEFAARITRLGGTISTDLAGAGDKFGTLVTEVDAAIMGIKKAAAEPVLKFLQEHFGDVEKGIEVSAAAIRKMVEDMVGQVLAAGGRAFTWINAHQADLALFRQAAEGTAHVVGTVLAGAFDLLTASLEATARAFENLPLTALKALFGPVGTSPILPSLDAGLAGGAAGAGALGSGQPTQPLSINVTVLPTDSSSQIADKIRPHVQAAAAGSRQAVDAQLDQLRLQDFFNVAD
jgi:hypothetical protein